MVHQTFLIADTHFSHHGVCQFLNSDGSKLRPWTNTEEMDEELVKRWNEVVRPCDKVYHLGDVAIKKSGLKVLERLNGKKVLIKGNHDIFELKDYTKYFYDIRAYKVVDKLIMSHIPIHPLSKGRFIGNIHGHTHSRKVIKPTGLFRKMKPDPFYYCVSVEQTDFRPISYDEVKKFFVK